jgi:hypothetical protein
MTLDDVLAEFQTATVELAQSTVTRVLTIYSQMVSGALSQDDAALAIAGVINRSNASATTLADLYVATQVETVSGMPALAAGTRPIDQSERLLKAVATVLSEPPKTKMTRDDVREALSNIGLDPADWDIAAATKITNSSIAESVHELKGIEHEEGLTPQDRIAAHDEHGRLMGVDFLERIVEQSNSPKVEEVWAKLQAGDYDHLPAVWEYAPDNADMRLDRLAKAEPLEAAQQATVGAMQGQHLVEGWVRHMDADPCQLCVWWWREGRIWPKEHPFQSHKGCNCQPKVVLAEHIQSTGFTRQLERNRAS